MCGGGYAPPASDLFSLSGLRPEMGAEPQELSETRRKVIDLPHIRRHSRGVVFGSAPSLVLG